MSQEPWLVAIDMQEVFCRSDSGWFVPRYHEAAEGIQALLPLFGDRVVLTRFVAPSPPEGAWRQYYRRWPFALVADDDQMYDLSKGFAGLDHPVVTETTFGKWGPRLADIMAGSTEMVLTGVSTDCCVMATALAACDAGVHVSVVADACAGISDEDHQRSLDAMALFTPLLDITTVEQMGQRLGPIPANSA